MIVIDQLPKIRGEYRQDADMAKFCWFQVGGRASALYKPKDIEDLQYFLSELPDAIPYFVFGVGSNILIPDEGFEGVMIRLGREFNTMTLSDTHQIQVGAATLDIHIADYACAAQIAGLEFLTGIPGTFGGALAMNAGAYGTEIQDVLVSARAINRAGELREFPVHEIGYQYRSKTLAPEWIFVDGKLQGTQGEQSHIQARIEEIQKSRTDTQPIRSKTGGSTFRNPPGHKAWQLIDQAGCRGLQIGGAMVSPMHCNFFINTGTATASDLLTLITTVKKRVYDKTGIELQEEIKIIGQNF